MKLSRTSIFKRRQIVNRAIGTCVFFHIALVMMASRFGGVSLVRWAALSGVALYLVLSPLLWLWHRTTRPARPDEGLSDIRDALASSADAPNYNPKGYFSIERGAFVGLDIERGNAPVYLDWADLRSTHMQVIGTTGSGKGVATAMLLAQCALAGEAVVIFDPKDDKFAPSVLKQFADDAGIPFHLLDLRPKAPPQFNIFRHCADTDILEIVQTAFDLGNKGDRADFYRVFDRAAARDVCEKASQMGTSPTMRSLVAFANQSSKIDDEKGVKFKADLEELAELQAIDTEEGLDLRNVLGSQSILYIIGSIRYEQTVRCQKMLLLRILQIIEQRNRTSNLRHVAMMLDELKYLLSRGALQALGTVRDKSCHIMLAHQSLGDLSDTEGLDPEAVRGAVVENTSLKLIYKAVSPDTAEWAALLSGTIVVRQESSDMQQGMFHAADGQYREVERPLITQNDVLALPKMTAMLFGAGLSRLVRVGHMRPGPRPKITPVARLKSTAQPLEEISGTPQERSRMKGVTLRRKIEDI